MIDILISVLFISRFLLILLIIWGKSLIRGPIVSVTESWYPFKTQLLRSISAWSDDINWKHSPGNIKTLELNISPVVTGEGALCEDFSDGSIWWPSSQVITRSETPGLSPIMSAPPCLLLASPVTIRSRVSSSSSSSSSPLSVSRCNYQSGPDGVRTCWSCLISITGEDTVATLRISRDCFPLLSLVMIDCYKLSSATATAKHRTPNATDWNILMSPENSENMLLVKHDSFSNLNI